MPRKKKVEAEELEEILPESNKKRTVKKETKETKKEVTPKTRKKKTESEPEEKKETKKKATTKTKKDEVEKKSTSKKLAKKSSTNKTKTAKKTTSKKASPKTKASAKKTTTSTKTKKSITKKIAPKVEIVEYYDLPYRYNQTLVKVLYQTPNMLFIYWDISDEDRARFVEQYGERFFDETRPVLIIHNNTMHYSFEVDIDDFANSWYLNVSDANCEYSVELGRREKQFINQAQVHLPDNYLYVTKSNKIESPNDHVLFDKDMSTVYFKDVKTNLITEESITSFSFIRNMGKIYHLFDLKTGFGKNNLEKYLYMDFANPSSSNPTSTFL